MPAANTNLIPLRLAITQGLFREEGLGAQLVQVGSSTFAPAMMSGEIDYASLFGATVRLAASGAPVKVVFVFSNKPIFYLMTQPSVASVPELRGQPVAVGPRGGSLEHLARDIFVHYGLDPDADLVTRPFSDISGTVPALVSGQVQGAAMPLPFNLVAQAQGMRQLVDAADLFRAASGGVSATDQRLQERPDEVRAVLRVALRGLDFARANRARTVAEIVEWAGIEPSMADAAYDATIKTFTADGLATDAEIQPEIDNAKAQMGTPDAQIPVSQVADFSLLRAVLAEPRR
ncbi:MAG TPA: ABC transporter substrate-binding protein [Chloroflexota bacterium]|jgi:ABC-type nitrate/sulfonate/bicarbonate transport system substrate-binding protein